MGRVINCHLESTRLSLTGKDYIAFLYSIAVSLFCLLCGHSFLKLVVKASFSFPFV